MAEGHVYMIMEKLVEVATQQLKQEVRLVRGVEDEIKELKRRLASIQVVFADAERREEGEVLVRRWLENLKDVFYEIGDVLDEWSTELLKIRIKHDDEKSSKMYSYPFPSPCFCFQRTAHRRDIAIQIRKLKEKLVTIAREKDEFGFRLRIVDALHRDQHHYRELTSSIINASTVFGREEEIADLVNTLMLSPQESSGSSTLQIITIVGTGGMGKTTLAQQVYIELMLKSHFQEMIWICVSDPFDGAKVINTIFEKLDGNTCIHTEPLTQMEYISRSLTGKKFMLVLDDVWTEDSDDLQPLIDALRGVSSGSKILVTTRNEKVAKSIGGTVHTIGKLSVAVSWDLFSSIAFVGKTEEDRKNMEEDGKKIVDRCKGLPLALKTIAVHLRYKTTVNQWREVLDSEVWNVAKKEIFPPLMLSYYDLPSLIKRCFLYCATLPKDLKIQPTTIIRLWMAQGYLNSSSVQELEVVGNYCLEELAMRSFFQDFEWDEVDGSIKSFKMHDIVHDFAQFLAKSEYKTVDIAKERSPCITSSFSSEKHRHLRILNAERSEDIIGTPDLINLHTLILQRVRHIHFDFDSLFRRMRFVKVLDLSGGSITDIPMGIGELKHLRYLDLSENNFRYLPEEICELCNLQTMCLDRCRDLEELPQGIGTLVNLRNLLIGESNFKLKRPFPQGIIRNTSLRTLPLFIVSSKDTNAAHIEDLRRFNHHEGSLTVRGLENVRDKNEAAKAELTNKSKIIDLTLEFQRLRLNLDDHDLDVAEGLEPCSALVKLKIRDYNATALPSWIILLSKLRILRLADCPYLKELPPLGRLVSLESLDILSNRDMKRISGDFWDIPYPMSDHDSSSAESASSELAVFPKLENMRFIGLHNLEEWEGPSMDSCNILPCLRRLRIYSCKKLKALPDCLITAPLLKELDLSHSTLLKARYNAHPRYIQQL